MNHSQSASARVRLAFRCAALAFTAAFTAVTASAQSNSLDLSVRKSGSALTATVTGTAPDGCVAEVYGAPRAAALATLPGRGVLVGSGGFDGGKAVVSAKKIAALKGRKGGRKSFTFRALATCGSSSLTSTNAAITVKTNANRGIANATAWLKGVAEKVLVASFTLTEAFPNAVFNRPVDIKHPKDGSNRLFVVEQSGKIFGLNNTASATKTLFLDLSDKIVFGGEQGLLAMAFHPNFAQNGFFFVHYSEADSGATIIARYSVMAGDPTKADPASEVRILRVPQPFTNHNGGQILFGPDGFLYIALGDGGSGGDPEGNGQDRSVLLGKILRLDVDTTSGSRQYGIPASNPFAGNTSGFREEIFAYGLRNPFKFSFDSANGRLWAGDVGQNEWEEVDIIESGKNYGWNTMEGFHCFSPSTGCSTAGLTLPVAEYSHSVGESITGGNVYRGKNIPALTGIYIYVDFISGVMFGLSYTGGKATVTQILKTEHLISAFGDDQDGELYAASYTTGRILKFEPK